MLFNQEEIAARWVEYITELYEDHIEQMPKFEVTSGASILMGRGRKKLAPLDAWKTYTGRGGGGYGSSSVSCPGAIKREKCLNISFLMVVVEGSNRQYVHMWSIQAYMLSIVGKAWYSKCKLSRSPTGF